MAARCPLNCQFGIFYLFFFVSLVYFLFFCLFVFFFIWMRLEAEIGVGLVVIFVDLLL